MKTKSKHCYRFFKRLFDILCSFLAIILLSWLYIILIIINMFFTKGKPFYLHERVGLNHKIIKIIKFKSMKDGKKLSAKQMKEFKENQKLDNDPRVTSFGKFLRKTSLDELPQLFNIFIGNISFIGPRPVTEDEIYHYGENVDKFLSVKPGLTGYWTVNGRSAVSYEERVKLELYYIDHASMWLDIKIFFKTFIVVFSGKGAS